MMARGSRTLIIGWALGMISSVILLVVAAATRSHWLHMLLAGLVPLFMLVTYRRDLRASARAPDQIAALSCRYMGIVLSWGALAMLVVYGSATLQWREWWHFLVGFIVAAAIAFWAADRITATGDRAGDGVRRRDIVQIAMLVIAIGLAVTVLGLVLHTGRAWQLGGKLVSFETVAGQRVGWQDWSANHVFFFGAIATAVVAVRAYAALRAGRVAKS
jgi:hypothetical protein